jgi:hypothetical protein
MSFMCAAAAFTKGIRDNDDDEEQDGVPPLPVLPS